MPDFGFWWLFWLVALVVLVAIELGTLALTTIWFAAGALVAFFAALLGANIWVQLWLFVIVSLVILLSMRPFAMKILNRHTTKTNVDSVIGRKAKVTKAFSDDLASGVVVLGGQEWSAKSVDGGAYQKGDTVIVSEVRGVTLYVMRPKEKPATPEPLADPSE
ncbi:MAG: NfeD family protein [Lachnospiraceae bacterium]|jgi:membrane protein implicated in regulation of membrane protease activity|nr:NfeD family protein [Lachnospiraceae bacterium]